MWPRWCRTAGGNHLKAFAEKKECMEKLKVMQCMLKGWSHFCDHFKGLKSLGALLILRLKAGLHKNTQL